MLLVLPKQDDVRKYGFFFDSNQQIQFKSISELRDLIRNSRSSVASISGNTITCQPMMGVAAYNTQARLYYSKLTTVAEPPDFTSDDGVIRTLLVTGLKDGYGRKSGQMAFIDNYNSNTPFTGNTTNFAYTPFALVPSAVQGTTIPTTFKASFPDTQVTVSSASRQTGDSYSHRRRLFTSTSATTVTKSVHSWAYTFTGTNYSSWATDQTDLMAFSMGAYLESVSDGGYWRATTPVRRNLYDSGRYVCCSNPYGNSGYAESARTIDKFALFIWEGTRIRAVLYTEEDFGVKTLGVGNTTSFNIQPQPDMYSTDPIRL